LSTTAASALGNRPPALAALRAFFVRHPLFLIVLGGAAIRFATLGSQGFWIDEHIALQKLNLPASEMLRQMLTDETNPPLYFAVAKAWQQLFGLGEVGLRSLSALAGAATIPVVYAAGRALGSRRAGLFAAALTASSPLMIWYSQEARPYALFAFFCALAFYFFVEALRHRGGRWLWGWAIASILAFSTHYFGFLSAGIEAVWLLWRLRESRLDVGLAVGLLGVASAPLVLMGLAQQHLTGWIDAFDRVERMLLLPQNFIAGMSSPWEVLPPLLVGFVVVVAIYALARAGPETWRVTALPAGVALAAIALTMLAMAIGTDLLTTRNLLGIWAPFSIALAALLASSATRRVGTAAVIGICATGIALAVWTAATPAAGRPEWKPVVSALGPPEVPRAIEYTSAFVVPLVDDLPGGYEPPPGRTASVQEIDRIEVREVPDYVVGPCSWLGVCTDIEFAQTEFPPIPPGFKLVDEGETALFTYRRYRRSRPYELPPAPVFGNKVIVQPPS
jgi:4-amino-4-deoxy-L-arabinose transferase-like glycosyltransferase